jgi:hypothetical protein
MTPTVKSIAVRKLRRKFTVPIYDAEVWLVVDPDIEAARAKFNHLFGVCEYSGYNGLCSYGNGCHFGIFFESHSLTAKIIAHEIFHLTHRISEWAELNFDEKHHEATAQINGYLTERVAKLLK